MPTPMGNRYSDKIPLPSSVAKKAARNAMTNATGSVRNYIDHGTGRITQSQLDRVVQSVNDATNRLSQSGQMVGVKNPSTKSSKRKSRDTVGPWKLGKTLGKGSSGRVRLAKNMETGQLAAIKIVPKKKSKNEHRLVSHSISHSSCKSREPNFPTGMNASAPNNNTNAGYSNVHTNPYGIEREIVIMKLISHPNVLGLYEVWENRCELYLVLEYVDGGELFDYLVSKGKLGEREAVHYFKQIVQGVSYCHSFNICHRDLKPENLLLDKKNKSIKIADFGMAALEISNKPLQTSCGSPHYASPEVVMGRPYHGGPSDVWSCGIILFALLTGHLPFNDDNIKKLLLKVQSGKFIMPQRLSPEAKDLILKILVVNPFKRITTEDILRHPFLTKYDRLTKPLKFRSSSLLNTSGLSGAKSGSELRASTAANIANVNSREDIDDSIVNNLQILLHGTSRELIVARLLQRKMSDEKLFYSLLLSYKQRHSPGLERVQTKQDTELQPPPPNLSISKMSQQPLEMEKEKHEGELSKSKMVSEKETIPQLDEHQEASTPKLQQKSQFSSPSPKQQCMLDLQSIEDDPLAGIPSLPSISLNPNIAVFRVPSQRTFRNSGPLPSVSSKYSLRHSISKSSLHHSSSAKSLFYASPSAVSLHRSSSIRSLRRSPKKTLQNSASKRSLYSQTSISKRSLNLNEYVATENAVINEIEQQLKPELPFSETNADFEKLCEQILFGNALDKILEEENEDDEVENREEGVNGEGETDISERVMNSPSQRTLTKEGVSCRSSSREKNSHVDEDMPPTFNFNAEKSIDYPPYFASHANLSCGKSNMDPFKDMINKPPNKQDPTARSGSPVPSKLKRDVSQKSNLWSLILNGLDNSSPEYSNLLNDAPQQSHQHSETINGLLPHSGDEMKSVQPNYSLDPRHKEMFPTDPKLIGIGGFLESIEKKNKQDPRKSDDCDYIKGPLFNTATFDGKPINILDDGLDKRLVSDSLDSGLHDPSRRKEIDASSSLSKANHDGQFDDHQGSYTAAISDTSDINVLAHSSLIRKSTYSAKRPSLLSHTGTFKNLSDYLQKEDKCGVKINHSHDGMSLNLARKSSEPILALQDTLKAGLGPRDKSDFTHSFMTDMSDMSYVMDMPSNMSEAKIVEVSNNSSADHFAVNNDKGIGQSSSQGQHTMATYEDTNINIFEDAPVDSESIESASSEDSRQNVRRKAVSIDTLHTSNLLTPAKNVRVSLYMNNINAESPLKRETTEEIISKFKLSPEKTSKPVVQKRYSMPVTIHNSDAQSTMTVFQDLEEERESENVSQSKPSKLSSEKGQQRMNRVTMLFDNDENLSPLEQQFTHVSNAERNDEIRSICGTSLNNLNGRNSKKREVSVEKNFRKSNQESPRDLSQQLPRKKSVMYSQKKRSIQEALPSVYTSSRQDASKLKTASETDPSGATKPYEQQHKRNWITRLIDTLKLDAGRLQHEHFTRISFDDTHLLTLHEFARNSVVYHLKSLDRKSQSEKVEYDCKFPNGFAFKIRITTRITGCESSTVVLVKRKAKNVTPDAKRAFQKFNSDITKVIKEAEAKHGI